MNPRNFWELLREKYSELTRSGRMVADYLTQHAEQAQYLSISALGAACGVAEATIFRFCRSLGFDGYNEMKIALAQANAMPNAEDAYCILPDTDTATLCKQAGAVSVDAINGTLGGWTRRRWMRLPPCWNRPGRCSVSGRGAVRSWPTISGRGLP